MRYFLHEFVELLWTYGVAFSLFFWGCVLTLAGGLRWNWLRRLAFGQIRRLRDSLVKALLEERL